MTSSFMAWDKTFLINTEKKSEPAPKVRKQDVRTVALNKRAEARRKIQELQEKKEISNQDNW